MTAQVPDLFIYNGTEYKLGAIENPETFVDIKSFGVHPIGETTSCWRGYVATFAISEEKLALNKIKYIGCKLENKAPLINNKLPTINDGKLTYEDINLIIDYTGSILITKDRIRSRYGFQSPMNFNTVIKLTFKNGQFVSSKDLSMLAVSIRMESINIDENFVEDIICLKLIHDYWGGDPFNISYLKKRDEIIAEFKRLETERFETSITEESSQVTSVAVGSFTDSRDGQTYKTVTINGITWMAQNLNYKAQGSWCYDDDESNGNIYGRLYNWDAAMSACPAGWRLPTHQEWEDLVAYIGGRKIANKLKSKTGWNNCYEDGDGNTVSGNGTDDYGFSALPGGARYVSGGFSGVGSSGCWWMATENGHRVCDAYYWGMGYDNVNVGCGKFFKSVGRSVRCVRDCINGEFSMALPARQEQALPDGTAEVGTFTDGRDGYTYRTVKIGNQMWMAQNLNYKVKRSWRYSDNDDESNDNKYGRLYDWDAAKIACPVGWHLPTCREWDNLVAYVGGCEIAGKKLKSKSGWNSMYDDGNTISSNGTDDYGFSALPGGQRNDYDGRFHDAGSNGLWWTATEDGSDRAYSRDMHNLSKYVDTNDSYKTYGYSVRCVRDCVEGELSMSLPAPQEQALPDGTAEVGTFTDSRDGQTYKTVTINGKTWMAQNLNYKVKRSWCYDNKRSNSNKYGRLYYWDVAKSACPAGWHLPTIQEWDDLVAYVGGRNAGKKLKSKNGWNDGGNGMDDYGFSALPGGCRHGYGDDFSNIGGNGKWWTATEEDSNYSAHYRYMDYDGEDVGEGKTFQGYGLSVRCVRD